MIRKHEKTLCLNASHKSYCSLYMLYIVLFPLFSITWCHVHSVLLNFTNMAVRNAKHLSTVEWLVLALLHWVATCLIWNSHHSSYQAKSAIFYDISIHQCTKKYTLGIRQLKKLTFLQINKMVSLIILLPFYNLTEDE